MILTYSRKGAGLVAWAGLMLTAAYWMRFDAPIWQAVL